MWRRALAHRWSVRQALQNVSCPCREEPALSQATKFLQRAGQQAALSSSPTTVSSRTYTTHHFQDPLQRTVRDQTAQLNCGFLVTSSQTNDSFACIAKPARSTSTSDAANKAVFSSGSLAGFKAVLDLSGEVSREAEAQEPPPCTWHPTNHKDFLKMPSSQHPNDEQTKSPILVSLRSLQRTGQRISYSRPSEKLAFQSQGIWRGNPSVGLVLEVCRPVLGMGQRQLSTGKGNEPPQSSGSPTKSRAQILTEKSQQEAAKKSQGMVMYLVALVIAMVGATYASVPLYRLFCQATGFGGTVQRRETVEEKIARSANQGTDEIASQREIVVTFNADVADGMPWKFTPSQREVRVRPGQSTLAFYTAQNLSDKPITGISTYNVSPMKAAAYFNKIQCFCFEEQRLRPGEKIDMPVFFYIDPEFATDRKMDGVNMLTLSYTFFNIGDDE